MKGERSDREDEMGRGDVDLQEARSNTMSDGFVDGREAERSYGKRSWYVDSTSREKNQSRSRWTLSLWIL